LPSPRRLDYCLFVKAPKLAPREKASVVAPTSGFEGSHCVGPAAPAPWEPSLRELIEASRASNPGPSWWTSNLPYFGTVETQSAGSTYFWDGMKRLGKTDNPFFFFQFSLAGWGLFEPYDEEPQRIGPGMGFLAVVPSRHRYYLPEESPGWTFGWLNFYHPYLVERVRKQIALTGSVLHLEPASALVACALRLISGSFRRDFCDQFELELALFEFLFAYERLSHRLRYPSGERERLLEAVRKRVLANPRQALNVDALAEEYGMTRSHFSHVFRARTGLTPARFVVETRVREAARMLLHTRVPLKQIAEACGFANPDHFSRVFRRFQHLTPGAYRRSLP
jgi:AraC-like DNA-binding protein